MSGCQGDMWAVGVMLTMIFTCTNPDWQLPFQPTAEDLQAMEALPDQDGVATALREAILRQQALWVSSPPPLYALHRLHAHEAAHMQSCCQGLCTTSPMCFAHCHQAALCVHCQHCQVAQSFLFGLLPLSSTAEQCSRFSQIKARQQ